MPSAGSAASTSPGCRECVATRRTASICWTGPGSIEGASALLGPDRRRLSRQLQVRRRTGDRRPPLLLPYAEDVHPPGTVAPAGAGRLQPRRMGLSRSAGNTGAGAGRQHRADPAAAAGAAARAAGSRAAVATLRARVVLYFAALGLAFLFVEMTFIQRFQLFLGHPVYAVSAVLCAFLVFAGLGSGAARAFARARRRRSPGARHRRRRHRRAWPSAICSYSASCSTRSHGLPLLAKVPISMLAIAPLAFCMGMPFPLGLGRHPGRRAATGAVGVGHQRLRVGGERDPRHPARPASRFLDGAADRGRRSTCCCAGFLAYPAARDGRPRTASMVGAAGFEPATPRPPV